MEHVNELLLTLCGGEVTETKGSDGGVDVAGERVTSELGARDAEREQGVGYVEVGDIQRSSDNAVLLGVGKP